MTTPCILEKVKRYVQRLENEDCLPILSPRAPSNSKSFFMEKPTIKQRKLLEEYKKHLSLSEHLFEIAIGTLLGDASIQTLNRGKTFRLKFSQSQKNHTEYLFHLYEM
jgi:hypothetical protein